MMKKIIYFSLLLIFTFYLFGQEFNYQIVKPETLYIGTPIQMEMEIITAANDSIFVPQIDTLDIFVLKPPIKSNEEQLETGKKTRIQFTFLPFDTGEHIFPEMEISVKANHELKTFRTVEIPLTIHTVLVDTTLALREIADPIQLHFGFWDYAAIVLLLIFIVAVILFLKKILKKKPLTAQKEKETDTRPAYQKALELLEQTKNKKLLENTKFLQFHFELSHILRFFLEHEYKLNAMEMTTNEIRENLTLENGKEKTEILEFLRFADKIKFAKFVPEYEQSKSALNWLETYLFSFKNKVQKESENV
jgi:hypothetical protein